MLTSLAFIFLIGLSMAAICQKLKLPRIIGMLITGIVLGPYVLNLLDPSILSISSELRQMALIIILLKAGLSLNLSDLKKVGRPAIMMSCVPASFEILAFFLFAPYLLEVSRIEAAVMGAVLGAVSPAVVVPRMVQFMDSRYGTQKSIPQLVMAGASCDDIFVIVLFTTFVSMAQDVYKRQQERFETLTEQMKQAQGITEQLLSLIHIYLQRKTPTPTITGIYPLSKTLPTDIPFRWWSSTISASRATAMCSIRYLAQRG